MATTVPSIESQGEFWGNWAVKSDRGEGKGDPYDDRVCDIVRRVAYECKEHERAIDIGCGTGWITRVLATRFGEVIGTDIAASALQVAHRTVPGAHFIECDFLEANLGHSFFDLVVSCEVIAHVADQRAFFRRCRDIISPGGKFLLITQNPTVWHRHRGATAPSPHQLRHWLGRDEILEHAQAVGFRVLSIRTLEPAGDKGLLFWRPYVQGALRRVIGRPAAKRALEAVGLGRSLVVEMEAVDNTH